MAFSHQKHGWAISNMEKKKTYYDYHRNNRSKSQPVLARAPRLRFAPSAAGGFTGRWVQVHPVLAAASALAARQQPSCWPPVTQELGFYYCILITAFSAKENLPVSNFHTLWINWWGDANVKWNLPGFNLNIGTWLLLVFLGRGLGAVQLLQLSFASLSLLDDKWVSLLNTLLTAGLVERSWGRVVQGDAVSQQESYTPLCAEKYSW